MSLRVFLTRLGGLLDEVGLDFMVCGSVAAAFHGLPRTTQDVDLVVEADRTKLAALVSVLRREAFYLSPEAALAAVHGGSEFNIVDRVTGWKADVFVQQKRPFSGVELERRIRAEVQGVGLYFASAEDCVLSKLEWAAKTRSERQLRDAAAIVAVQGARLDIAYLDRWAAELGVADAWAKMRGG